MKTQLALITMSVALAASAAQAQYYRVAALPNAQPAVAAPVNYGAAAPARRGAQARAPQQAPRPTAYTASRGPIAPQTQQGPYARVASNQGNASPARAPLVAQAPNYGAQAYGYGGGSQAPLTPIPQADSGYDDGGYSGDYAGDGCCPTCGKRAKKQYSWREFDWYWITTGDMSQHMPYFPNAHGYYYFHAYNLIHVQQQQEMVSRWGQDPRNPQDNRFFERIYQDQEAIQTQDSIQNEAMTSYPLR